MPRSQWQIWIWALPPYIVPLLRGLWDNWKVADRFGRMLEHLIVFGIGSWVAAFATNLAAWGSIWCFTAAFLLLIIDAHYLIAELSSRPDIEFHPFALRTPPSAKATAAAREPEPENCPLSKLLLSDRRREKNGQRVLI